jgi:hypothetical protein
VIRNHLGHVVLGHQPVARREIDTHFPFFGAHLFAHRLGDADGWSVHFLSPDDRELRAFHEGGGGSTRYLAKDGAGREAGAAGIVVIEDAADELAGGVQPLNRLA